MCGLTPAARVHSKDMPSQPSIPSGTTHIYELLQPHATQTHKHSHTFAGPKPHGVSHPAPHAHAHTATASCNCSAHTL
eukprot:scaffold4633_cov114-Isochrysis_galbana.AAC.2